MATSKGTKPPEAPDQTPLTKIQSERLSAIAGVSAAELVGKRPAELAERLKWSIDPRLWLYRRVCGQVVKRDPVTGVDYPVPFATVHVEDTDCRLLFYSPVGSRFSWFYPFFCRREEIATTRTDACGRFCVWIPRWDIDWILTWRAKRICFPVIFQRPSWREIIGELQPIPRPPVPPDPDPGPLAVDRLRVLEATVGRGVGLGAAAVQRLATASHAAGFGEAGEALDAAMDADAFEDNLHPPLPEELVNVVGGEGKRDKGNLHDLIRGSIAERVGLDPKILADLDLRRVIGPFRRCYTIFVPVWQPIFDVPDITFRVTQDVDGDGTEEQIYGESYFQVRWDAGAIPFQTLRAASWARESRVCDAPPPCAAGSTVAAINFAGLMPVTAPYHDNATGYGKKPNRPRPGGIPTDPATAPYCLNVNLFGCLPRPAGAAKYRLTYRYALNAGGPLSGPLPLTDTGRFWHPTSGPPVPAVASSNGWYDLPPAGLAGTPEESLLFPFDTTLHTPGFYAIKVEIGTAAEAVIPGATSAEVNFTCDNRAPTIGRLVRWSRTGGATWIVLPDDCPVVRRGTSPVDVLFEVTWTVMAPAHYRDSTTGAAGCGASGPAPALDPIGQTVSDWHTGPLDNAMTYVLTYRLSSGNAEGTYSFGCHANSRAFNPSGYVAGYQTNDWLYDIPGPPIYSDNRVYFSVINA
jgi:hypothetical protein